MHSLLQGRLQGLLPHQMPMVITHFAASHNIGVAIATSLGLVVPNIKHVQQLSVLEVSVALVSASGFIQYQIHCHKLDWYSYCDSSMKPLITQLLQWQIATELSRLIKLASMNMLGTDDITGGTITVSNFGAIGGKFGSPVLNIPEVAIVAIGRMQKVVQPLSSGKEVATVMNVRVSLNLEIVILSV